MDLGTTETIYKWLVLHCGEFEDRGDNTVDFCLQYRINETDEWQTADSVKDNREDMNLRGFTPVQARYVRLYITRPTPHADRTCRIYQFHVYRLPKTTI